MKQTFILAAFACLVVTGCAQDVWNTTPEVRGLEGAAAVQTLTEPADKTEATLRPGGQLVIVLESNPTTGYYWTRVDASPEITLVSDDYTSDPHPEGMTGVGGRQRMTIEAVSVGRADLTLSYQRSPQDVFETRTIKVKIVE